MAKKPRNFRKEYDEYHSKPEQKKNRAKRNAARRMMEKEGKVRKGDKLDVHHQDSNPKNNKKSNLKVEHRSKNRGRKGKDGKSK